MTDVGGVLARPEDVERITALQEGRPAPVPAETFRMLDIGGVQYRPEDAKRLGLVPASDDTEGEGEQDGDDGDPADAGDTGEVGTPPAAGKRQRRSL